MQPLSTSDRISIESLDVNVQILALTIKITDTAVRSLDAAIQYYRNMDESNRINHQNQQHIIFLLEKIAAKLEESI